MRAALVGLALVLISLTACDGDDDSTPTVEMLDGAVFKSSAVEGHEMVAGTSLRIEFDGDGIAANAGCNTLFGEIEITGGALLVGPMAQTLIGCSDDLIEQDQLLVQFLESGPAIRLERDTLTITGDGTSITAEKIE